jgi:hypothetical protein
MIYSALTDEELERIVYIEPENTEAANAWRERLTYIVQDVAALKDEISELVDRLESQPTECPHCEGEIGA